MCILSISLYIQVCDPGPAGTTCSRCLLTFESAKNYNRQVFTKKDDVTSTASVKLLRDGCRAVKTSNHYIPRRREYNRLYLFLFGIDDD